MYMNININKNIWNINMNMHMGHEHQHVLFLLPAVQLCRARSTRQEAQNAGFRSCSAHALYMPSRYIEFRMRDWQFNEVRMRRV